MIVPRTKMSLTENRTPERPRNTEELDANFGRMAPIPGRFNILVGLVGRI